MCVCLALSLIANNWATVTLVHVVLICLYENNTYYNTQGIQGPVSLFRLLILFDSIYFKFGTYILKFKWQERHNGILGNQWCCIALYITLVHL